MLTVIKRSEELDADRLMDIYREGNLENGAELYPDMDKTEAARRVAAGFVEFIKNDFLNGSNRYLNGDAKEWCFGMRYEFR